MIFITDAEKLQLEEFLIDRQWKPGTTPDTWVQFRWQGEDRIDYPYFFLAAERRNDDIFELGGMGIGEEWAEEEILTHLTDILKAGTDYGSRVNIERYLERLGVAGAPGHAINILRAVYGDLEVPPPPKPMTRTIFYEGDNGWAQFSWKGGKSVRVTTSVRCIDADGYSIYTGYIHSCHGGPVPTPSGIFGDRRQRESGKPNNATQPGTGSGEASGSSMGRRYNDKPEPNAGLPGLPEEVLLEVRGESRSGPTSDEPGDRIGDA